MTLEIIKNFICLHIISILMTNVKQLLGIKSVTKQGETVHK